LGMPKSIRTHRSRGDVTTTTLRARLTNVNGR